MNQPLQMLWEFELDGRVADFGFRPLPVALESPYLDYETEAALRLPFEGEWFVLWGGRTLEDGPLTVGGIPPTRFGYDLVIARGGKTYAGDGLDNEDYYCFGEPILSPADGTVWEVVDGIPDNAPGSDLDWGKIYEDIGNYIILNLDHNEYFLVCHLQEGSLSAAKGDSVTAG
jgi:hypothetical protein